MEKRPFVQPLLMLDGEPGESLSSDDETTSTNSKEWNSRQTGTPRSASPNRQFDMSEISESPRASLGRGQGNDSDFEDAAYSPKVKRDGSIARRVHSLCSFKQSDALAVSPETIEGLSEKEVYMLTRQNTKRNSQRKLKAKISRIRENISHLSPTAPSTIEPLPLARPTPTPEKKAPKKDDEIRNVTRLVPTSSYSARNGGFRGTDEYSGFSGSESDHEEAPRLEDVLCVAHESSSSDSHQLRTSSASKYDLEFLNQSPGALKPAVRISTAVTVLSSRPAWDAEIEARTVDRPDHPSRNTAKALVPIRSTTPRASHGGGGFGDPHACASPVSPR